MNKRNTERILQRIRKNYIDRRRRFDADEKGQWVTTEKGHHIHLNEEGEPDKGNPHVLAKAKGQDPKKVSSGSAPAGAPASAPAKDFKAQAESFRNEDMGKIPGKKEFVKKNLGTKPNKITREPSNIGEIMKEGGVDEKDAKHCAKLAENIFDKVSKVEPKITEDVVSSVKSVGGTMYGLDYRLKQSTSMARKIASDSKDDNVSFEDASDNIKDAIRYTAVFEPGNFTEGYKKTKADLESKGYREVRCKNYYQKYKDDPTYNQKAVQCVYANEDGQMFEFQFHTVDSQGTKEVSHEMYKEWRDKSTTADRKAVLNQRMRNIYESVKDPDGVYEIKSH